MTLECAFPVKDTLFSFHKIVQDIFLVIFAVKCIVLGSDLVFQFPQYGLQGFATVTYSIVDVIAFNFKSIIAVITESKIPAVVWAGTWLAVSAVDRINSVFNYRLHALRVVLLCAHHFESAPNDFSSSTIFSRVSNPADPSVAVLSNPCSDLLWDASLTSRIL